MIVLLLGGCGLHQLLPSGPVVGPYERLREFPAAPSGVVYEGEPAVDFPVLPVLAWGAAYDLDLVLVDRGDVWDMHEYAMLRTPSGPLWLAKDARIGTLQQEIVADLPDIDAWMPELPVVRKSWPLTVDDRSTDDRLDLSIRYENTDGLPVEVDYEGPPPEKAEPKRNGCTMGHSRNSLLAVLDVSNRAFAKKARLVIGGEEQRFRQIAGLVPFRMVLVQTQAGLAIGRFHEAAAEGGFTTAFEHATAAWTVERDPGEVRVVQSSPVRDLVYVFRPDPLELARIEVRQWDRPTPVETLTFSPALPDLRRRFEGHARTRYVIDVNGQTGHAVGWLDAWWEADGPRVALLPEAPWWTVDRPMQTAITYANGAADVVIERVPTTVKSGTGAKNRSPVQPR